MDMRNVASKEIQDRAEGHMNNPNNAYTFFLAEVKKIKVKIDRHLNGWMTGQTVIGQKKLSNESNCST